MFLRVQSRFLWMIYGVAHGSIPIAAANALTLVQSIALVVLRLRYGPSQRGEKRQGDGHTVSLDPLRHSNRIDCLL